MSLTMFVDPVDGIDGTGTYGVDWLGNPGNSELTPRKTIDCSAGFQAGMKVLLKRGTTYSLTGIHQRVSNGATITHASYGLNIEIGTSSTLEKNRIYFGAYGSGARPVLDGRGVMDIGIYVVGGITIEDLEIKNVVGNAIAIATSAPNVTIRRCYIHHTTGNANNSTGVYVRGTNVLVEKCIFDYLGADGVLTDTALATGLRVRKNFFLRMGSMSLDGADGVVNAALGESFEMSDCLVEKMSRQKQGMFIQKLEADPEPSTAPIIERNAFVGPCDGSGTISLISVPAATVRRNFICGPRGIGLDRLTGTARYSEGCDVYANVIVGTVHILRPAGTGSAEIDAAGYPDGGCLGGTTNASNHVVNKFRNNLLYNVSTCVSANLDTGKNEFHNNIVVRTKGQAMNAASNASCSGNILFDEGSSSDGFAGTPVANIFHDSGRTSGPTRIPGCFPNLTADFGLSVHSPGYWAGDGTQAPAVDLLGTTITTDNAGAGCVIGPTQVTSA